MVRYVIKRIPKKEDSYRVGFRWRIIDTKTGNRWSGLRTKKEAQRLLKDIREYD